MPSDRPNAPAPQGPPALCRFLLGDATAEPSLKLLRATALAGHAFTRLQSHPKRSALQGDFLYLLARHRANRAVVAGLLRAWEAAGIQPLLMKGFHLAEFVYPSPGQRTYGDVDLVVAPEEVATACRVAEEVGWAVTWRADGPDGPFVRHGPEYRGHEAAELHAPGHDLQVDLHRRIVHNLHNFLPHGRVAERLTVAVREAADTLPWEGVSIRVPCPVDAVAVGLALNRCWGSDGWQVKPRDYADFKALAARHGVTAEAVMARAEELGVARSVAAYLRRCDPGRGSLDLRVPSWWQLRRWNLEAGSERGPYDLVRVAMALTEFARGAVTLARVFPLVVGMRQRLRRCDLSLPDGASTPPVGGRPLGARGWRDLRRALHRSLRLLRVTTDERERLQVLCAAWLLRRRGIPAQLEITASGTGGAAIPKVLVDGRPVELMAATPAGD